MDLDNLKYSELQKLAKAAGIRANMKVEKLLKALKEHYSNQEQSESDGQKTDTESSSEPNTAEEDLSPSENKDDTTKKKATRGKRKGARGKAKKTSPSDKSQGERVETPKADKSHSGSTTSKQPTPKSLPQKNTPVHKKSPSLKRTPQGGTPNISKTPVIVKPVTSKTLQNRTPKVNSAKAVSIKTPGSGPKNMAKNVVAGRKTPGPFSPKRPVSSRPSSAVAAKMTPNKISGSGKKLASSTTKENKKTPVAETSKRRSPRNQAADENKQQVETTPGKTGNKLKRQNTFDLEGPSLTATATPEAERTTKRAKRSSGTSEQDKATPSSPGIQDMIDSMSGEISSAERRNRLMSAINKKVEGKVKSPDTTGPVTQIPRFAAFLAKKKQEQKKPITPGNKDWDKVHKKEFAKFDSIDVYLEKKRKRADEMTASVKKARTVLHEVQQAVAKLKNKRTPSLGKKSASQSFKPSVMSTKDMNLNFGATASKTPNNRKSAASSSKPFKPTVTSTKDMSLNFSSAKTPVNDKKAAENKTPASGLKEAQSARKSMGTSQMSARKSLGAASARRSPSNTPFHFTGNLNVSEVKSAAKPTFDLKASLARPITWKPHTGKLKPLQEGYTTVKTKDVQNTTTKPEASRMDIFKSMVNRTQRTYSRHDRRLAAAAKRAEQKSSLQMKRRGITVSP